MEIKSVNQIIEEVQGNMNSKNYEEAYEIAKNNIDLNKEYNDGEYVFKNLLEEYLFKIHIKKEIKRKYPLIIDYSTLYSTYGELLLKFERFEEAKKSFKLSLKYNPTNIKGIFGLAEIKKGSDIKGYYELILDSFKYAYSKEDLSNSFKKLADYYSKVENNEIEENKKISENLMVLSNEYSEDNNNNNNNNNSQNYNENISKAKEFLKEKGLPYGASIEIITICKTLGFQLEESKKVIPALHYFNIAYELSKDENIKITIDDLNKKIEKRME